MAMILKRMNPQNSSQHSASEGYLGQSGVTGHVYHAWGLKWCLINHFNPKNGQFCVREIFWAKNEILEFLG